MKYLIVGGAGFVGANLARRCLSDPSAQVTVFDSLDPHYHSTAEVLSGLGPRLAFVQGDIHDAVALQSALENQNVIFNCAGQTSHPYSMTNPLADAAANCLGNLRLLEAIREHAPGAMVVYASSSTIVGRAAGVIVDEEHPERPCDIYSANKGVAEKYHQMYHDVYGLKTVSVRLPNLFGPFGKADPQFGFINYFISLAHAGRPITVYGDGMQSRNVLYVEDAAECLWQVARNAAVVGETYFASGDEHPTVRDIAEAIDAGFGGGGVTLIDWPAERERIDVGDVRLSSARLREAIGWRPQFGLVTGLEQTKKVLSDVASEAKS